MCPGPGPFHALLPTPYVPTHIPKHAQIKAYVSHRPSEARAQLSPSSQRCNHP